MIRKTTPLALIFAGLVMVGFVLTLVVAEPTQAQVGHPAKGSWLGYWGPDDDDQQRIRLLMNWENQGIVATINPGPKAIAVTSTEINYDDWTMTLKADMPVEGGSGTQPWVATGTLDNLGSWYNRRFSGTYHFGDETGQFLLHLN